LCGGTYVAKLVEAREFQQDVETAHERAGRSSSVSSHKLRSEPPLPGHARAYFLGYGDLWEETSLA
jgi:hypothetical protein